MGKYIGALFALPLLAFSTTQAASATSVSTFNSLIASAEAPTSPGGTKILRSEMSYALSAFVASPEYSVNPAERAYLSTVANDETLAESLTSQAANYLGEFYLLNDAASTAATTSLDWARSTPAALFSADGPLSASTAIAEGSITGSGAFDQITLQTAAGQLFHAELAVFVPVNYDELIATASADTVNGTPTPDEVNGLVAYVNGLATTGYHLYSARWDSQGNGFYYVGNMIAAVSPDLQTVRLIQITNSYVSD